MTWTKEHGWKVALAVVAAVVLGMALTGRGVFAGGDQAMPEVRVIGPVAGSYYRVVCDSRSSVTAHTCTWRHKSPSGIEKKPAWRVPSGCVYRSGWRRLNPGSATWVYAAPPWAKLVEQRVTTNWRAPKWKVSNKGLVCASRFSLAGR